MSATSGVRQSSTSSVKSHNVQYDNNENHNTEDFVIRSRARLPLPSSFVDTSGSRIRSTMFASPTGEMPIQIVHGQSRVPQTIDGYQTRSAEIALIKDLLFIFQGINGSLLKETQENKYDLFTKEFVNPCVRQQAVRLCCLGSYYKIVKDFIRRPSTGIITQGLKHGLSIELQEYYRMIALMHKAVGHTVSADTPLTEEISTKAEEPSLVTLTVWTWDVKKRLQVLAGNVYDSNVVPKNFLAQLVIECGKKKGGELCSTVFPYCENGCPVVSTMAVSLLSFISKPLYSMICEWILYGELEDHFNEFFIASDPNCRKEELWHSKYTMREKMIPEFIPKKLAARILATGKNINFLKEICQNSAAYEGRDELERTLKDTPVECLFVQNDPILHEAINKAYETTSSMVLSVLMEQSRLVDHLNAIKKYLLLGQGDFIQHLLELVQFELNKPASRVFYHNLSSILESAVRSTNAQFEDEEILARLDIRLLRSTENDLGWDVFCLDYKVQGPIGTVLSENAMGRYHQLFNTLWRIKRIEAILSVLWKNQTSLFKLQCVLPELGSVLHRSQLLISEMIHFVHQTQYYIMFEATECAWDRLLIDVEKSSDLDEVISAHESFLDTVTNRSLLNSSSRELLNQLRGIFDTVHEFKDFLNKFDSTVMVEYERRKNIKIHSPEQLREAQKEFFKKFVSHAKGKVETIYTAFQDLVRTFLLKLNRQQELNLQCLSFRLDFNEHYQQKDARLTVPLTYQHRRLSMGNVLPSAMDFSILTTSMENSINTTIPENAYC